jgi:hypothetical protein
MAKQSTSDTELSATYYAVRMLTPKRAPRPAGDGVLQQTSSSKQFVPVVALALAAVVPALLPCSMFMMFSCRPGYHSTSEYSRNTIYVGSQGACGGLATVQGARKL